MLTFELLADEAIEERLGTWSDFAIGAAAAGRSTLR
jgi:hypothetical protein